MLPITLRQKGAACRRLARLARQPEIARALLELAEDFEQAAFECEAEAEAKAEAQRISRRKARR
jgi:hypothetical protein